MATSQISYPVQYPTNQDFNTSDPRKIAAQNLTGVVNTGNQLYNQQQQRYNAGSGQAQQTQDYLGGILAPQAEGNGGYNAQETSQIEMTPEQQQQMVTAAGISAGTATEAAADAGQRAANAAGGNPQAVAAYRARAANQAGAQAGNAETNARVQAQAQEAANTENVGQARLGQQTNAENYYGNLQSQQNTNAQNAANQEQQTYATQAGGSNQAAATGVKASQTPSTFDKIIGGVGGALNFLDDGDAGDGWDEMDSMQSPDPVNGAQPNGDAVGGTPTSPATVPFWKRFQNRMQAQQQQNPPQGQGMPQGAAKNVNPGNVGASIGSSLGKVASLFMADGGFPQRSIRDEGLIPSYGTAKPDYLADGGMGGTAVVGEGGPEAVGDMSKGYMDKGSVFDKPTAVRLDKGDAVVPLGYRANAKVRPSAAMPMINNMQAANKMPPRRMYPGLGNPSAVMA